MDRLRLSESHLSNHLKLIVFDGPSKIKKPKGGEAFRLLNEKLAATYSRGSYTTTTIGKTVFDGRVRNGIGSDHSFMATKKL
jgi:hypothetical protein